MTKDGVAETVAKANGVDPETAKRNVVASSGEPSRPVADAAEQRLCHTCSAPRGGLIAARARPLTPMERREARVVLFYMVHHGRAALAWLSLAIATACSLDSREPAELRDEAAPNSVEKQPSPDDERARNVPSPMASEMLAAAPEMAPNVKDAPAEPATSDADARPSSQPDAGVIDVMPPEITESFDLVIGPNEYSYECGSHLSISGIEGVGPVSRTIYAHGNGNDCEWLAPELDIGIYVQFVNFLASQQRLAVGEFDLSDPSAVENVRVRLIVNRSGPEVPVGTTPMGPFTFEYTSFSRASDQFTQLPNVTGTVVSRRDESVSLERYRVELTNVTLLAAPDADLADFPASVTIRSAWIQY